MGSCPHHGRLSTAGPEAGGREAIGGHTRGMGWAGRMVCGLAMVGCVLGGGAAAGGGGGVARAGAVAAVGGAGAGGPVSTATTAAPAERPAPGARYAWPLDPAPVVRTPFRPPAHAYGPGHRGVDLAGAPGQQVLAARAGQVVFAGALAGRGVVSVQHDDGLRTTYEPVTAVVAAGVAVAAGEVIGLLEPGHPGCPDPACLHWGVRRDRTEYLDPLVLLAPRRLRLLPLPEPWPWPG